MFRFVLKDLKAMGFEDRQMVSTLERYMKCGVGKCGHCCIGHQYVCTDGPVYNFEQIRYLPEHA
jgi:NAD(P)H-flavin reductase